MIQLKDITDSHLQDISEAFADAFLAEEGVVSYSLKKADAFQYFYLTLGEFVRCGCLYTTSVNEEGYIVYYRKDKGLPWYRELLLTWRYFMHLSLEGMQKMLLCRNGWVDYPVYHTRTPDFIDVCLVCVCLEYQHQGYLKKLLAEPFRIADELDIPVILDTDSEVKAMKYQACGMEIEKDAILKSGIHMYTMIRRRGQS